ncbi:iap-3 [Sucra jujuba nucleopolyhedrovirus]|uniref:Iap-3 n=1 Tax=Sucra jujuba nucleopolyhedrovirus TaxID=1563660 RepID=A0A097P8X1_9ABAC|nr:iap-3 [Sucra jujuba nucleopolyhedrovirus]AIU41275.1 iap-3 [Sucra jujuba nucleopolyhedrovirus]
MYEESHLFKDESVRVKSFDENWPHGYPLTPKTLAAHGFYFADLPDKIRCCECSLEIQNFGENKFIGRFHERMKCSFANVRTPTYVLYNTDDANRFENLLKTFDTTTLLSQEQKRAAAEAGFRYDMQLNLLKCDVCDCSVFYWDCDNFWTLHVATNDKCEYVLKCKGANFVQQTLTNLCAIPASVNTAPTTFSAKREGDKPTNTVNYSDENRMKNSDKGNVENCSICLGNARNACLVPCGHMLCLECAIKLNGTCPFCRSQATVQPLYI